jgi:hypothetical protein
MIDGILSQPEVCYGMRVVRIEQQAPPNFGAYYAFKVGSPVLAKSKKTDGKVRYYIYSDPEANECQTFQTHHYQRHRESQQG